MKRILLAVGMLCIMGLMAAPQAQASTTGVKLGFNVASIWGDDTGFGMGFETEPRLGLNAGIFTQYDFMEFVGIQTELLYTQKGIVFKDVDDTYINMDYIEIPIMVRGMIPIGIIKPFIYAGVHVSILVVGDAKVAGVDKLDWEDFNTFDWGLVFGGGVDLTLGPIVLHTDLRYTLGMRSGDADLDIKNGVFFIDVGVGF